MYVRDLENIEYITQTTYLIEEELNGNCVFSAKIPPNKVNLTFLNRLSEMWTLVDDNETEYKVVYLKKQGEGQTLTAEIKAVPKFYDDFDSGRVYEEYNQSFTANACFATIFNGSGYVYQLNGSYNSLQWEGFGGGSTRLEMFKDALNRYGAEFKVLGKVVTIEPQIGVDLNVMYRHRLNASNIVQEVDASGFWTYAKGYGDFTEEDGWQGAKLIREYTSPLASIPGIGVRHAPPLKDGRIKLNATMENSLKKIVNESLKISVTADIHDLTKQKYPIAQSGLGDRVFLIDERIGLDAEVRVVNRSVLRDWRGNILDVQLTFGNQDITKRYQSNLDHAAKTINDLIEGREKLPINAMAAEVANVTSMILGVTSELDITPQGLIAKDKNNPNYVVVLNSAGLGVSTDGGMTFRNAITGRGVVAERILAGEIKGSTLRTDSGSNYVHIEKQFIRLMESNLTRLYLGYYTNSVNQLQPTIVLGGDSSFQDGSVVLSQQPTQGFLGIINGKDSNGDPYFVSSVMFRRSGDLILKGGMNGSVTVNSGKGINNYANGGSYWVEATDGIGLKGGNKSVLIDSRTAIVFSLNEKNMLDVVDNNGETDLRFQTLTLRNGTAASYAGKLQVKSGSGTSYSPVVASNFETSSQRKYKTNIRDVQFSALEKIMALNIQQYNLKTDMEQLYEMRMNRQADDETVLTTKDITTRYGWIADDENNPECFVTKERNAAEIYSSLAIQIRAFQEEKIAKDKEIDDLKTKIKAFEDKLALLEQKLS
ncbi:phage tail protein [Bacillus cereus]|uniref:Prophage endopeptidase tail family protein n=1 Tax=Bacillus cereus 03BB108 TaxID=451709 RepID=A0AAN0SQX5_BACCE|nr:phage tail protein [Bacillus cereus]AJI08613.1 prophage endopeptidase tail family protein [Bacillus cereus 03BB108]EDX60260.1 phage minor structural protein, N- region [Bacillus cereus 03BB108]QKH04592.1 phage tail protein [Bacillus cereus]